MESYPLSMSVVIPVYNGSRTIAACLESLLAQTYPLEGRDIIVVENGSTDNTTEIVRQYPVRLLHSERRGPPAARNLGIANSEADIVAFMDADCVADPNWLSELVKPYADPEVGGVGGTILAYRHPHRTRVERFSEDHAPLVNFVSGADEFLPHLYTANASYRRDLLKALGGFNPNLITADDVDLAWRLQLQTGTQLCYADKAIVYHHHRSTRAGLAKQYRQYGFGEVLLDTLYGGYPGYPRSRWYQARRMWRQAATLPRYAACIVLRQIRMVLGQATPDQAIEPQLQLLIESSNLRGKLDALVLTRWMCDAQPALHVKAEILIERFFPNRKS